MTRAHRTRLACLVATSIVVVQPVVSAAAARTNEPTPPVSETVEPLERPGDPPAPPVSDSTWTILKDDTVMSYQGFVSVQVNVDAEGRNILGDAANEPSIAVDPTDPERIAIGWRQFDSVVSNFRQAGWGWSDDRGRSWTFPGVFTPGVFRSDPVLEADGDGRFYYYSLRGSLLCDFFFSDNGGQTWAGPRAAYGGDKQWFAIDRTDGPSRGHIYASWSLAENPWGERVFIRSTDGGQTFSEPIVLRPAPIWGTVTVDADGVLYLTGNASFNRGVFVVYRSLDAWDAGVQPTFDSFTVYLGGRQGAFVSGPNPDGLVGQLWIDADRTDGPNRGDLYIVSSVDPSGGDPQDVHFIRSSDRGETWSLPVRVNTDDRDAWQWFATMSVAPNGRIDVVWVESLTEAEPNIGQLMYGFSTDGGASWSTPVATGPVFNSWRGWPNQNKLGDYYDMASDDTGADLAYAATYNGEQDVYYMRVWADCDGNGASDAYDMWLGTVRDCNDNTIPDTCEIAESPGIDINADGVIDACLTPPRAGGRRVTP